MALGVAEKCKNTCGCVIVACGIVLERFKAGGSVVWAFRVPNERESTCGRVVAAGVVKESVVPRCRVAVPVGVAEQRRSTGSRVAGTSCITKEGERCIGRVVPAAGVT